VARVYLRIRFLGSFSPRARAAVRERALIATKGEAATLNLWARREAKLSSHPDALSFHRRSIALLRLVSIAAALIFTVSSCGDPATSEDANKSITANGIISLYPPRNSNELVEFQLLSLFDPRIKSAKNSCEGGAGSVLPPLSFVNCTASLITKPLDILESVGTAFGAPIERSHVILTGIQQFWVQQTNINDCWAAVLETARRYHHFHYISQDQILDFAGGYCPRLASQPGGANTYQILYIIVKLMNTYRDRLNGGMFCKDSDCIIDSLKRGSPVIMLKSGHAVLIIGADYLEGPPIVPKNFKILDPASATPEIEDRSVLETCGADVLIPY
jgi:hypothetical protein